MKTPPNAGKGRKKGVPNKRTTAVKEALELAFQGIGGVKALVEWAKENRGDFYGKLWIKLLPIAVATAPPETTEQPIDDEHVLNAALAYDEACANAARTRTTGAPPAHLGAVPLVPTSPLDALAEQDAEVPAGTPEGGPAV